MTVNNGLTTLFISALQVDPTTPSTAYVGTALGGVFKTTNGGTSWAAMSSGLLTNWVAALAIDPTSPTTLYAGMIPISGIAGSGGVFKSTDGGRVWAAVYGRSTEAVTALAIDRVSPSTIYAGVARLEGFPVVPGPGGVIRSTDAGMSWTPTGGLPTSAQALAIDPASPSTIYAGTSVGMFKSTNGGTTWTEANYGLGEAGYIARRISSLVINPAFALTVYAGTPAGVFRSTDGGLIWLRVNDGLMNLDVRVLAVDLLSPSNLYAGTADSDGVFSITFAEIGACTAGPTALCENNGRFKVQVGWRVPSQGTSGMGQAMPLTSDTGSFWFFSPNNIELVVKVVDGRTFNGKFWVFYGALSDVEYTVTVTDTTTGIVKTYFNPRGQLASVADIGAF